MSQSTDAYTVANGSGATVRAAINADLQALNSNNGGSSAPASPVAGMWWVDTGTGLVKQRDSTNASWITRFKLNGDAEVAVASASTCDIGSDGAACVEITGTVTITSLGTSAPTGSRKFIRFAGALTLTYDGIALILPGGVSITTAAGDCMIAEALGSGNWRVLGYFPASGQSVVGGKVAQVVNTETGTEATGTTIIPLDNTVPQNTEGDQYMSLAITPKNASSILLIDIVLIAALNTNVSLIVALFQDSTANALAAAYETVPSANDIVTISFRHKMTAGTTSSTTFKVRAGPISSATLTFNGDSATARLGGVLASSITITEVLP